MQALSLQQCTSVSAGENPTQSHLTFISGMQIVLFTTVLGSMFFNAPGAGTIIGVSWCAGYEHGFDDGLKQQYPSTNPVAA